MHAQRIIGYEGFRVGDSTSRLNRSQSLASVMLPAVIIPSLGISEGSHMVHIVSAQCAQSDSLPAPWLLALAASWRLWLSCCVGLRALADSYSVRHSQDMKREMKERERPRDFGFV